MKSKHWGLLFVFILVVTMLLSACGVPSNITTNTVVNEQLKQVANQSKYANDVPNMGNSTTTLERTNLKRRMELWNDPNKIGYIYLLSDNGIIMAFFTIKGKVSSLNSYLTGSQVPVDDPRSFPPPPGVTRCRTTPTNDCYNFDLPSILVESPDYDGSYGDNGGGVFFFLTDGTYMEWNGPYLLADQPVKLSQQPLMTYDVTGQ